MATGKIKILSSVQKFYQMMGVYPSTAKNNQKPPLFLSFNSINVFMIVSLSQLIISTVAFISIKAKSTNEFGIAFYVFITATLQLAHLLIAINKISNISELIGKYEAFIEKSK